MQKLNRLTGLIDNQDGSHEFIDGEVVAGVNNWIGTKKEFSADDFGDSGYQAQEIPK